MQTSCAAPAETGEGEEHSTCLKQEQLQLLGEHMPMHAIFFRLCIAFLAWPGWLMAGPGQHLDFYAASSEDIQFQLKDKHFQNIIKQVDASSDSEKVWSMILPANAWCLLA